MKFCLELILIFLDYLLLVKLLFLVIQKKEIKEKKKEYFFMVVEIVYFNFVNFDINVMIVFGCQLLLKLVKKLIREMILLCECKKLIFFGRDVGLVLLMIKLMFLLLVRCFIFEIWLEMVLQLMVLILELSFWIFLSFLLEEDVMIGLMFVVRYISKVNRLMFFVFSLICQLLFYYYGLVNEI